MQDIFVTYLKWKNKNYKNLFDGTWSFGFHENSNHLDINIYRDNNFTQLYNSLYRQFGIELEFISIFENYKILLEHIQEELILGNILGACIDTFYCNWTNDYQKKHNTHYVLISGIQKDCFIICDVYVSRNVQYLSIDVFFSTAKNLFFFRHKENENICQKEFVLTAIDTMFEDTNRDNDFKQMRKFANILKDSTYLRDELNLYNNDNVVMYPLLLQLNNIGYGRKCFSIYLEEMCCYYQTLEVSDIISSLNKIAETWGRFSMKIVKYSMNGYIEATINQLAIDICSISILEEELALNLKNRILLI